MYICIQCRAAMFYLHYMQYVVTMHKLYFAIIIQVPLALFVELIKSYNVQHTMYDIQCTAYNVRHILYTTPFPVLPRDNWHNDKLPVTRNPSSARWKRVPFLLNLCLN